MAKPGGYLSPGLAFFARSAARWVLRYFGLIINFVARKADGTEAPGRGG